MRRLTLAIVVGSLVLGFGTACLFRSGRQVDPEEGPVDRFADVTVQVKNDNFYDATIYVLSGDIRERLGNVGGGATQTFRFGWRSSRVRFVIALLAVGEYPTEEITTNPGDELELQITPDLHRRAPAR